MASLDPSPLYAVYVYPTNGATVHTVVEELLMILIDK